MGNPFGDYSATIASYLGTISALNHEASIRNNKIDVSGGNNVYSIIYWFSLMAVSSKGDQQHTSFFGI
ncbi:predicted protein [Lichtheimia corymbifera JMRC:FSU:9682]|uniref:Uncharacterized protein n=1 Tax=Lichtheimia corymbifera JMRC:FSU:9682 TaxID=1263082 RepID=A0A068SFE0_9FUNG|nr:predicted protein [Lichtheimia corymbifera JMRC:FSU:9682]CDH61429.1 predicted protein [Lichtheimia corymbifera JMRC:FSU:9682]